MASWFYQFYDPTIYVRIADQVFRPICKEYSRIKDQLNREAGRLNNIEKFSDLSNFQTGANRIRSLQQALLNHNHFWGRQMYVCLDRKSALGWIDTINEERTRTEQLCVNVTSKYWEVAQIIQKD